ncbi:MAG: quinone-dependent dihydroorotate dehydrogenase [Actinomycetaceae bacterium]|nr:quinone-dependent dihydroorotate dehydrogenase [Actinomycetaceae bacterium]
MLYKAFFHTVLRRVDPETAHVLTMKFMSIASHIPGMLGLVRMCFARGVGSDEGAWVFPQEDIAGFARPLPGRFGLAAGLDKDGEAIEMLSALGFAFVEVGTVTPKPQPGNDKPRLWRLVSQRALRNRMGFNNSGADVLAGRLKHLRSTSRGRSIIVGANIGKNKTTPLEVAPRDYGICARKLARWVDYLVINVSSPNTPGLRTLQDTSSLQPIVKAVQHQAHLAAKRRVPIFVKIAPDMADHDLRQIASLVHDTGIDGVIATNTTIDHDEGEGGLSGKPLNERSRQIVTTMRRYLGDGPIIIGCGGVTTPGDAQRMRDAGANLVQGYSAFIYEGPSWPGTINRHLTPRG